MTRGIPIISVFLKLVVCFYISDRNFLLRLLIRTYSAPGIAIEFHFVNSSEALSFLEVFGSHEVNRPVGIKGGGRYVSYDRIRDSVKFQFGGKWSPTAC